MANRKRNNHQRGIALPLKDLNREYAKSSAIEIYNFVKRNAPLAKRSKLNGKMLYIDSESVSNTLILTGRRLYADEVKGFSAPVNKREPARPHVAFVYGSKFRVIDTKTKFGNAGVYIHDVDYYGNRKIKQGFFGVKNGGEVRAYGIDENSKALPAYSISLPEWVVEEQGSEISRILAETFERVFKRKLGEA